MFKNNKKEKIECEVVEFDHVCERNDDTDFKIETVDNFLLPFHEFCHTSQDCFKYMVDKYVVNITDEELEHMEYSTRSQQSSKFSWEYRKGKLTTSNFYIGVVRTQ